MTKTKLRKKVIKHEAIRDAHIAHGRVLSAELEQKVVDAYLFNLRKAIAGS